MRQKGFGLILILIILGLLLGFWFFVRPYIFPVSYRTDYAEGSCSFFKNKCEWAGDGCGGGHGFCTNDPTKYEGAVSTCDINDNFPANQGYKCSCLFSKGMCGWVK